MQSNRDSASRAIAIFDWQLGRYESLSRSTKELHALAIYWLFIMIGNRSFCCYGWSIVVKPTIIGQSSVGSNDIGPTDVVSFTAFSPLFNTDETLVAKHWYVNVGNIYKTCFRFQEWGTSSRLPPFRWALPDDDVHVQRHQVQDGRQTQPGERKKFFQRLPQFWVSQTPVTKAPFLNLRHGDSKIKRFKLLFFHCD